jgi:hypothetical protein
MRISVAGTTFLLVLSSFLVPASSHAFDIKGVSELDTAGLADLEARAEHAQPSEQAYLFTQLVSDYVDMAGKQVAAGDTDKALASLEHIQSYADRIHAGLGKNSKRIKNAEMMLHMATYKLTQIMHAISTEDSALLQTTVKRLDKLHDELLQQVFSH